MDMDEEIVAAVVAGPAQRPSGTLWNV